MSEGVTSLLGADGPVSAYLGGSYEPRPEQQRMAAAVERALEERDRLLVEAGTGVGKSFAYLVPAIQRCIAHGERVVVATNTITLQEQLLAKDIPLLRDALDGAIEPLAPGIALSPVLVKGRGNYVSIRRLQLASQRQERLFPDAAARRSLHQIEDWATDTTDGTLSTLPQLERPGVWDRVQSDSGNCMGRRCPQHSACFYQSARRAMEQGNLLVCNHALFFSDLALRARDAGFLPTYDHVILDEAHGVEDAASDHFGLSLTEGRVAHLLSSLYHDRTGKGYLSQLELDSDDLRPVERTVAVVRQAEAARRGFFDQLASVARSDECPGGRVRSSGIVDNTITGVMNELAMSLRGLKERARTDQDRFELNAYAVRASEIADAAEALVDQTLDGCVYWIEAARSDRGAGLRVKLACSPIEVGPLLREHLFDRECSVVLTSATLATRTIEEDEPIERAETAFSYTIDRLGCDGARTLQLGSPFDHAEQAEVYVDRTMPDPRGAPGASYDDARRAHLRGLVERVLDHVIATDGGAFVLFTSFDLLNRAADALRLPLAELEMPLLAQGKDGSRSEILERFRENGRSVLLGAASFWQGIDVRGDGLRNVIITRLPFDPPDRPLTEARLERIRERGGDPFRSESLPRAVIRFKQGIGRLIRSSTDRGRIVVLDPRVLTKSYGRSFAKALPEGAVVHELR